jgi:hypothetical protein
MSLSAFSEVGSGLGKVVRMKQHKVIKFIAVRVSTWYNIPLWRLIFCHKFREYRDMTVNGAITQCYRDMGARHRLVILIIAG